MSVAEAPASSRAAEIDALIRQLLEQTDAATDIVEAWLALHGAQRGGEALLGALKDESERLLAIDSGAAEHLANLLISGAAQLRHPRFQALGWMTLGDVRRAQGRFPEAVTLLESGGEAFLALGDEVGWARSRTGWGLA